MRKNYRSETKNMTDEQVLAAAFHHHKYLGNDLNSNVPTSNLAKLSYYKTVLARRGYSEEQVTDYMNARYSAETI